MKLSAMAFANASGVLGAIYFLGCYLVAAIFPDSYKAVAESWMHMINLSGLWKSAPEGFLLGLVSFTLVSWVTGWFFAWLYNSFTKK